MALSRILLPIAALLLAAAAAALLTGGACSGGGPDGSNVLLFTLDTTRADHLGCYGNAAVATPRLDGLAREGVLFENCATSAPITLPAHASLMTGTDPFVHGARTNGGFVSDDGNVTLAEILSDADFTTGAVTAAFVLHSRYGLAQGFGSYLDAAHAEGAPIEGPGGGPGIEALQMHNAYIERRADEIADLAIAWLEQHAGERFFLWVHFFDPHTPYDPPTRFRGASGIGSNDDAIAYAGEVAFMDEQLGRVLDALERLGLADDTIVAAIGDHGEGLGQHGEATHCCFLYDTTVSVPCILRAPGRLPAERRVGEQVRIIDIAPSILDLLGLQPDGEAQGVSLLPLIRGEETRPLAAYSETMIPRYDFGFSHLRSMRWNGWKYIHAPQPELYRVSDDPGETVNAAADNPDIVDGMRSMLRAHLKTAPLPASRAGRRAPDEDERKKLMNLGYMGGSGDGSHTVNEIDLFEPVGEDPKDRTREIHLVTLGLLEMSLSRLAEARAAFEEALALYPGWWIPKQLIATVLAQEGRHDEAIALIEGAVAAEPENGDAHHELGKLHAGAQNADKARFHFREALLYRPDLIEAYRWLTNDALAAGRIGEAVGYMREAVEIDPSNTELKARLALTIAASPDGKIRSGEEALALARKANELTGGGDAFALFAESVAHAELGQFDKARELAERAEKLALEKGDGMLAARVRLVLDRFFVNGRPFRMPARPPTAK